MISTMNRHAATALMLAACSLSASADQPQKQTTDQRPNIVVIVTDDHSYQTLGTCEKDSPMPYPNFRKLADEGMVFDRSYCANSLCGPSRACIYTGRHSHMNGYLFNEHAAPFDGS
ncbi:sulfatase-like hydrolase/transferase, partial [uncultured Akkermansia sp.]